MTSEPTGWTEDTSQTFLDLADVAIPDRREQIEVLLSLTPAADDFTVADVACGDGTLSEAILDRYPSAHIIALDGSDTMRRQAAERLSRFGDRAEVRPFTLEESDWIDALPSPLRCVVSSLAVHHLDADDKRALFCALASKIESGGALLIADVVIAVSDVVHKTHREAWSRAAREQSLQLTGSEDLYKRAEADGWGYLDEADEIDKPDPLFDQLKWLEDAGFRSVDCFWMRAGFAVFGGYV